MLHLHSSNRVEILADRLGDVFSRPLADPFQPETVLVHSQGLERWLALRLAERFGICANVAFPYPAPFLNEIMTAVVGGWDVEKAQVYETEALTWSLMDLLPEVATQTGGEHVAAYLDVATAGEFAGEHERRLYHLAATLAPLFDRYQIYRPHLLRRWEQGRVADAEHWQAALWRALVRRQGPHHRVALRERFTQALARGKHAFPERLSLFGISSLAPFYIELLAAIASHTEVHVFFLNPCQEYWGDILSQKQRARMKRKKSSPDLWDQMELGLSAEPDYENELLAYFGKLGRDFFDLVLDQTCVEQHEHFVHEESCKHLLGALQRDILLLREGACKESLNPEIERFAPSIQVHSCHSRMREVETLNDVLLDLFESNPELTPRDIVVMAPAIELYTSKIHAVFGRTADDHRFIPFSIADRTARLSHALGNVFLRILALAGSRWTATEVLGILESEPVLRRFGLTEPALDHLRRWLHESGVRWGRDAEMKEALGLPAADENTWRFGLDRLVLGHALSSGGPEGLFAGVLPHGSVTGGNAPVMSAFLDFWAQLTRTVARLEQPHSVRDWAMLCREMVAQFFVDDPAYERETDFLYTVFQTLEEAGTASGFADTVSIVVLRDYLERRLEATVGNQGFFAGGITFCNLLPMRSLPAKVVVLLGMSSQEFPRMDRQLAFDLVAQSPARGDRSLRHEDRHMFLEALLAAREKLIILYTGQSSKDNSEVSQSVFVSQLQDYIKRVYDVDPAVYTTKHRLQPFSPAYFDPQSELFSYAAEYAAASERLRQAPLLSEAATRPLPEEATGSNVLTVQELISFFQQPVASFYHRRFSLFEPWELTPMADVEPIDLTSLDSWQIQQWLLQLIMEGQPASKIVEVLRSSGLLPHGNHGQFTADHFHAQAVKFAEAIPQFLQGPMQEPVDVDLTLDSWRLTGRIDGVYPRGLCRLRFGKIRQRDRMRLWVEHLILHSLPEMMYSRSSAFLGREAEMFSLHEFATPAAAQRELQNLLRLRAEGIRRPLPLFPKASLEYVRLEHTPAKRQESMRKAWEMWRGQGDRPGEAVEYFHQLAYGHHPKPLNEEFQELSKRWLEPLLNCTAKH